MKFTVFDNVYGGSFQTHEMTWPQFTEWMQTREPVPEKADCPLISLSLYGDTPSAEGSYKHAANITGCWGAEIDYDGEVISFANARQRLEKSDVRAFLYTTPSHKVSAPRWRVIIPFDQEMPIAARLEAVERVNGILGGGIAGESFTPSQGFYAGSVENNPLMSATTNGRVVLGRQDLPRVPRGYRVREGGEVTESTTEDFVNDILSGENLHPALTSLAWRGWDEEKLTELAHKSSARQSRPKRYERMITREIAEAVATAERKRMLHISRQLDTIAPPPRPERKGSAFVTLSDMLKSTPPLIWAIDGLIEARTYGNIFGDSNVGKSFMAVDMACCLASGIDWRGRKVDQGRVLYISGEGHTGIARRIHGWLQYNRPDRWDFPLSVSERNLALTTEEGLQELYEEVAFHHANGEQIKYLFLDTLSRVFTGVEQNDQMGMQRIVEILDKMRRDIGCTTFVIHHSAKDKSNDSKGAMDFNAALDWVFGLREIKGGKVEFWCRKMRDGKRVDPMQFRLIDQQIPVLETGEVLSPGTKPQAAKVMQTAVLELVIEVEPEKSQKPAKKTYADHLRDIIDQYEGRATHGDAQKTFLTIHPGADRTAKKAFSRALAMCVEAGTLIHDEETGCIISPLFEG